MACLHRLPLLLLVALLALISLCLGQGATLEVFHSTDPSAGQLVKRGEIRYDFGKRSAAYEPTVVRSPEIVEGAIPAGLMALSNDLYIVAVRSPGSPFKFMALNKCFLYKEGVVNEDFVLHASFEGKLYHVDYYAGSSEHCREEPPAVDLDDIKFKSTVRLESPGSTPTASLLRGKRLDASGKEETAQESKSFIVKYWYIVLPLMLILLVGGGEEPQGGGKQ